MNDLLRLAAQIWSLPIGRDLRLIGGLAVRLQVGPNARITRDIDIVALTRPARDSLLGALAERAWHVGEVGPWTRASRAGEPIVDVGDHPVVSPRTFDAVTLRAAPRLVNLGGTEIRVAGIADLALLKLIAQRDQDMVDLYFLSAHGSLDARAISSAAEQDDIERRASEGAARLRHAVGSGELGSLVGEVAGSPADPLALAALARWLDDLHREGI